MVKVTVREESAYVPVRHGEVVRDGDNMPVLFPSRNEALQYGPCGFRSGIKAIKVKIHYESD